MNFNPYSITQLPRIEFGEGSFSKLAPLAAVFGKNALVVTGSKSFKQSACWPLLREDLTKVGISWQEMIVSTEPSPQLVDQTVDQFKKAKIDVVLGIGGGSVLDAAKAVAGLLRTGNSIMDYLEGVGPELPYVGPAVPFIAVPTTAGTGSEATKNAVLSVQGEKGFKKSFRHEILVPQYAIVDPDLLANCSSELIAANGMDAFTQLLESYVSIKANEFTDALAFSGLRAVKEGLLAWYEDSEKARDGRNAMAYAALISGITLAQAGLGSVHGLASPLGAFFPIPHGVVCGTLVAAATEVNIHAMQKREPQNICLKKYAEVAELLYDRKFSNEKHALDCLVQLLYSWTERMKLSKLNKYGVTNKTFNKIITNSRGSSMKTNPIVLTDEEIGLILEKRL